MTDKAVIDKRTDLRILILLYERQVSQSNGK